MKRKLKVLFLIITALVVLSSCLIVPDDPSEPTTEKFTYTSVFKGPVRNADDEITSYQFMCYVNNNSGQTLEDVEFEIKWVDSTGKTITKDTVTIPRLEKGAKWPVGVIHDSENDDLDRFSDYDEVSIKYISSSSDFSRYTTNLIVNGQVIYDGTTAFAHGTVRNNNTYKVLDPIVYIVSETSSGKYIAEYGMDKGQGAISPLGFEFGAVLNPRAKTPSTTRHYFFAVARRSSI